MDHSTFFFFFSEIFTNLKKRGDVIQWTSVCKMNDLHIFDDIDLSEIDTGYDLKSKGGSASQTFGQGEGQG